ncbi:MFS transporter [Arsenicicoccus dermatophilus]|uniref:MFS transporter n=1 Tax=Arsenicicoccus dermatophilus TaxID=1076331 RepID=UPI0039173C25
MPATVPQTPRWLMAHGREEQAREVVGRLTRSPEEAHLQVQEIHDSLAPATNDPDVPFLRRQHRSVTLPALTIAMCTQMSGIDAILCYAPEVMRKAGASTDATHLMSVAVGLMNLVATMAALTVIDRFGRRRLMLAGSVGYLISLGFLSGVMFFCEIFPKRNRGRGPSSGR